MNKELLDARNFCEDVRKLAKQYNLPFFVVTDGASATYTAVKHARDSHIKWVLSIGFNPNEVWGEKDVRNRK